MTNMLQPVEYNNQRILTTAQLAEAYETDIHRIHDNFGANKERYTLGEDYFILEGTELKKFKSDNLRSSEVVSRINKLILWTEFGAMLHAKSLNTDKAWEFYKKLVRDYFRLIREQPTQPDPLYLINEAFARRTEYNARFHIPGRFTVLEKTNVIALGGQLKRLGFADNAFLDTSLGKCFPAYCKEQGMDMSQVQLTKDYHLVGHELNSDKLSYNWRRPIYKQIFSYPDRPFCLVWEEFGVNCYWPEKFLPYIQSKYKGAERVAVIEAGEKVMAYFSNRTIQKRLF